MSQSRLEQAVAGKGLPEATAAVKALHRTIWEECAEKSSPEYGDALIEAGFLPEDRDEMATYSPGGSLRIAQRILKLQPR